MSVTLSSICATDSPVSDAIWLMSITSRNCGKAQNQMEKRAEWHLAEHTMGIGVFLPQTGRVSPWMDTVKGVVTKAPFLQKHLQTHSLQIHTDTKANYKCIVALRQKTQNYETFTRRGLWLRAKLRFLTHNNNCTDCNRKHSKQRATSLKGTVWITKQEPYTGGN